MTGVGEVKARLIRIGNSRGVRLPKAVIAQVGLADEVDIDVHDGAVVIRPARRAREGWAEAARRIVAHREDQSLDGYQSTRFDREEWTW